MFLIPVVSSEYILIAKGTMFYVKNLLHKKNGLYNVQLYTPKGSNH